VLAILRVLLKRLSTDEVPCILCKKEIHKSANTTIANRDGAFCSVDCANQFWQQTNLCILPEHATKRCIPGGVYCSRSCWYFQSKMGIKQTIAS